MLFFFFLVFLMTVAVHSADASEIKDYQCPMSLAIFDHDFNRSQVFLSEDRQGRQRITEATYFWMERPVYPNIGVFEMCQLDKNYKLAIAMEYGRNPETLLRTDICFEKGTDDVQRAVVMSWAASKVGQTEGYVTVMAPSNAPITWTVPKPLPDLDRPFLRATVEADKNRAIVTQYVFSADEKEEEGVFVRMCVGYKNLSKVSLSWGTEAYSAAAYPGTTYADRVSIAEEKFVDFRT